VLAISVIRLAAAALAIPVVATPLKLAIITPLRHSAYKATRSCAASNTS
jgi:hypothetical protein